MSHIPNQYPNVIMVVCILAVVCNWKVQVKNSQNISH